MQINIGLNISSNFNNGINPSFDGIKHKLKQYGFVVSNARVQKSNTEYTFVSDITHNLNAQQLNKRLNIIANMFKQDCIAIKHDNDEGKLIGTYSHQWGEFNNKFFIDV